MSTLLYAKFTLLIVEPCEFVAIHDNDTISKLGGIITSFLGKVMRATPKAMITFIVTLMSCFYLSIDYDNIREKVMNFLPISVSKHLTVFKARANYALKSYVRAYLSLMLLTFIQVFIGLLILGQKYAFLIALAVAAVDVLPIFGAGTVLLPWAIIVLLLKNYSLGTGLMILYGIVTIVRQIAEPRIVGSSLGIHPLLSLFSMFAGLQLFGFIGMLLGPAVALVLKEFLNKRSNIQKESIQSQP